VYINQGKVDEAIALYEESLSIQRSIGNQQGIAATLHAIANVYINQGKVDEAIALYEESLSIQRSIGNAHGDCKYISNVGTNNCSASARLWNGDRLSTAIRSHPSSHWFS
jgi:tetratricopeptide (TPR) repeat protein